MNIGIDIDDTISNSFESVFVDSQKFDIEELGNSGKLEKYGKIDNHNYIETLYPHWGDEKFKIFWDKYFINMLTKATPKQGVVEILKKLRKEGNKIILITSRHEEDESTEIEKHTRKWLEKNDIEYDKLVMNAQNKLIAAKQNNIDLFIDDSVEHCRKVKEGKIESLLFNSSCNQGLDIQDIERAYSWIQVYKKYTNIKNKK